MPKQLNLLFAQLSRGWEEVPSPVMVPSLPHSCLGQTGSPAPGGLATAISMALGEGSVVTVLLTP